jgi:hypothetical protein
MVQTDINRNPLGTAIATGTILAALMDLLIKKDVLTIPEVRSVLETAMKEIGPRTAMTGGLDAAQFIGELQRYFSERNV